MDLVQPHPKRQDENSAGGSENKRETQLEVRFLALFWGPADWTFHFLEYILRLWCFLV